MKLYEVDEGLSVLFRRILVEMTNIIPSSWKLRKHTYRTYVVEEGDEMLISLSLGTNGDVIITVFDAAGEHVDGKIKNMVHRYGGITKRLFQNSIVYSIPASATSRQKADL